MGLGWLRQLWANGYIAMKTKGGGEVDYSGSMAILVIAVSFLSGASLLLYSIFRLYKSRGAKDN